MTDQTNLPVIAFSSNFNNKLDCKAFSTIRMRNDARFKLEHDYSIVLKDQPIYVAKIVSITHFRLNALSPAMSYLDSGYDPTGAKKIISNMYSKKGIDVNSVDWSFIVLVHKMLSEPTDH